MTCDFSFRHYQEILENYQKNGYTISSFECYDETKIKTVILRHDIDTEITVKNAAIFANIEKKLGITATYFYRIHAREYNPLSFPVIANIKKILQAGHEIGLHYEVQDIEEIFSELKTKNMFALEKNILEVITQKNIISVARHGQLGLRKQSGEDYFRSFNPKKIDPSIKNNAYENRYFKDMKYISDSMQHWREGCAREFINKYPRLQILFHHEWWYEKHLLISQF